MGFWASDRQTPARKVPLQINFVSMTTFCIAFYESYLPTEEDMAEVRQGRTLQGAVRGGHRRGQKGRTLQGEVSGGYRRG